MAILFKSLVIVRNDPQEKLKVKVVGEFLDLAWEAAVDPAGRAVERSIVNKRRRLEPRLIGIPAELPNDSRLEIFKLFNNEKPVAL